MKGIVEGRRDPNNRGTAMAGTVLGIIGTVLIVVGLLAFAFFFVAGTTVETIN